MGLTRSQVLGPGFSSRKAFALTIDAIFALVIMIVAILIIANMVFQQQTERSTYLKLVSLDTLKLLESRDYIGTALNGNTTSTRELFNSMQSNVCMRIIINNELGEQNLTIARQNCEGYGKELQTGYRAYIHNGKTYTVQLTSWFKK